MLYSCWSRLAANSEFDMASNGNQIRLVQIKRYMRSSMNTQIHERRNWAFSLLLLGFTCTLAYADDWPQWRGPRRDGISRETGLLKQWPAEGPKLLWQQKEIGGGYSTPAIVR